MCSPVHPRPQQAHFTRLHLLPAPSPYPQASRCVTRALNNRQNSWEVVASPLKSFRMVYIRKMLDVRPSKEHVY